jgi:hypothetical protein
MKNIILLYAFLVIMMLGGNNGVFASSFNKMLESNNFDPNDITNAENIIIHYCMKYTDSAALGVNVVQELIGAGLISQTFSQKTCQQVESEHNLDNVESNSSNILVSKNPLGLH